MNNRVKNPVANKTHRLAIQIIIPIIVILFTVSVLLLFLTPNNVAKDVDALSSSTTYYKNGSSYYTLSSSVQHYRCTNSKHSGHNDYTTSSVSGTCYDDRVWKVCSTCEGDGYLPWAESVCYSCGGDGGSYVSTPRNHSISTSYVLYTYTDINTGSTTTSQTAYTRATGYTITYNANGGSGSMASQYFLHGHAQALNSNNFTRANYTFSGWSTSSSATTPTYTNGQTVTSVTTGSSATLYAVWQQMPYTITLDPMGGTVSPTTKSVVYNTAYGELPTPNKTGYSFTGWFTQETATPTTYSFGSTYRIDINSASWAMTTAGDTGKVVHMKMNFTGSFTLIEMNDLDITTNLYNLYPTGDTQTLVIDFVVQASNVTASGADYEKVYRFFDLEGASTVQNLVIEELWVGRPITSTTINTTPNDHTIFAAWNHTNNDCYFSHSPYQGMLAGDIGSFENTGWRVTNTTTYDTTHVRSGKYSIKITLDASVGEGYAYTVANLPISEATKNHIYYVKYYGYQEVVLDNTCTEVFWPEEAPHMSYAEPLGPAGQWNMYSYRTTRSGNALVGPPVVRIDFDNRNQAATIWYDDFMIYDLTAIFGEGNEPELARCDALFDTFVGFTSVAFGNPMPDITAPVMPGYQFNGYFAEPNGAGKQYYDANGVGIVICDLAMQTTLYPYFTPNTYDITFDANTGTVPTTSKSVTVEGKYGALPTPIKTGYNFLGWYAQEASPHDFYNYGSIKRVDMMGSPYWSLTTAGDIGKHVYVSVTSDCVVYGVEMNDYLIESYMYRSIQNGDGTITTIVDFLVKEPYVSARGGHPFDTGYRFIDFNMADASENFVINTVCVASAPVTQNTFVILPSAHALVAVWEPCTYKIVMDESGFRGLIDPAKGGFEENCWGGGSRDTTHVRTGQYAMKVYAPSNVPEVCLFTDWAVPISADTRNHIYYIQYYTYQEVASPCTTQVYWPVEEPSFGYSDLGPAGQWNRHSFYSTRSNNTLVGSQQIRLDFDNNGTEGMLWYDDFMIYDLTAIFGEGNEPTHDWCNRFIITGATVQDMRYDSSSHLIAHKVDFSLYGHAFAGWSSVPRYSRDDLSVGYADGENVINLADTQDSHAILYAVWQKNKYTISVEASPNGTCGEVPASALHDYYAEVTLYAYANKGYQFSHWLLNGETFAGNDMTQITVTVIVAAKYTAVFVEVGVKVTNYAIRMECASDADVYGRVSSKIKTIGGTQYVIADAVPSSGYVFSGWKIGETLSATYTSEHVLIPLNEVRNSVITAVFASSASNSLMRANDYLVSSDQPRHAVALADSDYLVTVEANIAAAVEVLTGAGRYSEGSVATLTAYAKPGYQLAYWLRDGKIFANNSNNVLTVSVNTSATYTAYFVEVGAKIKGIAVETVCVDDSAIVDCGMIMLSTIIIDDKKYVSVTATPESGYEFVGWAFDSATLEQYPADATMFLYTDIADKLITAKFVKTDNSNANLDTDNS